MKTKKRKKKEIDLRRLNSQHSKRRGNPVHGKKETQHAQEWQTVQLAKFTWHGMSEKQQEKEGAGRRRKTKKKKGS